MNSEFQWWLLILGIVIGGALVYLVLADIRADDEEPEWLGDVEPRTTPDERSADPVAGGSPSGEAAPRDEASLAGQAPTAVVGPPPG